MEFFIKAQDGENTLKALKKIGVPALCGGNPDKVERWLLPCKGACPPDNGWLGLFEGAVCMCRGLTREADRLVKNAYEKFSALNDREGLCLAMLLLSKILAYKGDFEGSLILSDYVLAAGNDIDDNLYYNMAMQKAFCLSIKGEFDAGILAAETGAEVLNRRGSRLLSALLQRFLALPYYMKGDYKRALYYYHTAKDAVGEELPRNDQLLVDLFISRAYRDTGDFEKSRELFENTIHLEKSLKYSENLYVTYYHYSLLFSDSGDFSEALHYICLSEELAVNGGVNSWFLDVSAGHKSFLLSRCGKPEEGLAIARKLLERIGQNRHFLFSGALFYSGFTFLQANERDHAERCMLEAFSISKSAGFGIIECYSAGMLSYIYSQSGRSGQAEEYASTCLGLAAAGNYMQGFITIPQMLECIKIGLAKGYEPDFISRVLGRMDRTPQFRAVIDSMKKLFFTGTPQERDNIFETLGRLSASGSVSGIPRIFVCTFENLKVYVTGEGLDTEKWRTNKAKELFAYLLNKKGGAVSSEKLITELWPGSPPDKARSLLYANIVHIKSKLGKWGLSDKLKKVQNGYLMEEKDVFCDKWLVDGELESCRNRRREKLPEWLAGILKDRSFMEDIYSDWVLEEQNKLEIMIDEGT
jgi:tetratricopeptide (TPR) repeat protein